MKKLIVMLVMAVSIVSQAEHTGWTLSVGWTNWCKDPNYPSMDGSGVNLYRDGVQFDVSGFVPMWNGEEGENAVGGYDFLSLPYDGEYTLRAVGYTNLNLLEASSPWFPVTAPTEPAAEDPDATLGINGNVWNDGSSVFFTTEAPTPVPEPEAITWFFAGVSVALMFYGFGWSKRIVEKGFGHASEV